MVIKEHSNTWSFKLFKVYNRQKNSLLKIRLKFVVYKLGKEVGQFKNTLSQEAPPFSWGIKDQEYCQSIDRYVIFLCISLNTLIRLRV